jgi:DNA-binding response OmpR family regulator
VVEQIQDAQSAAASAYEVATVRWPAEALRREDRLAAEEPSLLLVEAGAPVPETDAFLEDWASVTAPAVEVDARLAALARRAAARRDAIGRISTPTLDVDNVLRVGDRSLILAPIEVRLLREFLKSPGSVISREVLTRAVWPDGEPKSNSLDVRLVQLRKRLAPLRLSIMTFPKHGYMLELPN